MLLYVKNLYAKAQVDLLARPFTLLMALSRLGGTLAITVIVTHTLSYNQSDLVTDPSRVRITRMHGTLT